MSIRRILIVMLVLIGFGASVVMSQQSQATKTAEFGSAPSVSRPFASHRTPITSTWYCPGVPAGDAQVGGEIVIANPTDVALLGTITLIGTGDVAPIGQKITVPARDTLRFDVDQAMTATFVSATVELVGGEGMVEQRALFPAGDAVASCTTQTSDTWYFADGFTVEGSVNRLIITNPSSETANINLTLVTQSGQRQPSAFQGYSVAPQSVQVIGIAENGLVDEPVIAIHLTTTTGRVVVAREQHYVGGGRLGYTLNLGAPSLSDQAWFAFGETGPGITEQYVIYNPTSQDVAVEVTLLGFGQVPEFVDPQPIPVAAGKVVTLDMDTVVGLPDGPHSIVFSTLAQPAIIVDRVFTEPAGSQVSTSVVLGMTSEYVVTRWYVPIGVETPTENALIVQNLDFTDATVTVKAIGPGGAVAVPGLEALALPASGIIQVSLTDPSVLGRPLVVESTQRIFVERRLPRGPDLPGRSGSWALPECGPCNFSSPQP